MATAFDYRLGTGAFDSAGAVLAGMNALDTVRTTLATRRETIHDETDGAQAHRLKPLLQGLDNIDTAILLNLEDIARAVGDHFIKLVDDEDAIADKEGFEGRQDMVRMLRAFMVEDSETINAPTVASSVAYGGSNTGTGKCVVGTADRGGNSLENARPEKIELACIADAQGPARGIVEGEEVFTVEGRDPKPQFCHEWISGGSGMKGRVASVSLTRERGTGKGKNTPSNGSLEAYCNHIPSYWTNDEGDATTHIVEVEAPVIGTYGLKLIGDAGGTKPQLSQACDGTLATRLKPATPYLIGVWVRQGTAQPAAGVLRLSLEDGSDTILNTDDPCQQLVTCSTLTGAYVFYGSIVWTPYLIPDAAEIVLETSTALGDGENIYVGAVVVAEAFDLWVQDPKLAVVSGGTPWVKGDTVTVTITNDRTTSMWVGKLDQIWDIHAMQTETGEALLLPSNAAGAETIGDGLIT